MPAGTGHPGAVIVAGGRGSRYGDPLKCARLLPRLVARLRAAGCARVVVAGDHAGLDGHGWERAPDAVGGAGPLGGIVGGLRRLDGCAAAVVLAGDMHRLEVRDLRRLLGAWRRLGRAVQARQGPHPVLLGVLPATDWPVADDALASGRRSVHRLFRAARARPLWFAAAAVADLDRPGDLLKFRAAHRR